MNVLLAPDRNYRTGVFKYVQCQKCSSLRLIERPKQSALSYYYPQTYKAFQSLGFESNIKKNFRRFLKKNELLARIFIKDTLFFLKPKGKILDVGAGNGRYMQILKSWGWETYGVEPNRWAVRLARSNGIENLYQGFLKDQNYNNDFFDVVRLSHVLEHTPNPLSELKEIRRVTKSNGKIFLYLPNYESFLFRIFKSYWYNLDPPRHFYHYSPQIIEKLLKSVGYNKIEINFQQSPYSIIRSLAYLLRFKNVEKRFGIFTKILSPICMLLILTEQADMMEVTAQKK